MQKLTLIVSVLAIVIAGVAIFKEPAPQLSGIVEYQKKSFVEGLYAGTGRQAEITRLGAATLASLSITGDATVSGGTLNVTTSNTATSTVIGGCFQFYATSTATAHKFQASTTPGIMYSQYGACPNL
jgi:hypothetical protein